MHTDPFVVALIFIVALLYASVGHGGASGYLAVFTLLGATLREVVPLALMLNILVASVACMYFLRSGAFSLRMLIPFVVTSIPAAWLGGRLHLPTEWFHGILALALAAAALRLTIMHTHTQAARIPTRRTLWIAAPPSGMLLGFIAGVTGIGGGVFLSPLLLLVRWTDARGAAAIASAFIVCNSAAGLAGNLARIDVLGLEQLPLAAAAVIGGAIGARIGASILPLRMLEIVLGSVLAFAAVKLAITVAV